MTLTPKPIGAPHDAWRAFLPAIAGVGLQQPGRYAAFFFRPIHKIRV